MRSYCLCSWKSVTMSADYTPFEIVYDSLDNATYDNDSEWYDTAYDDYVDGCCSVGYERVIVPLIFCVVIAFGCVGNILVIVVVIRNREQYASTTNIFIVNLAVADLAFLVFCVPFHAVIYTSLYTWPFGNVVCKVVHGVQFASMAASIYTLVAMSLDRFLAVGYPLRTKHLRQPPAALAVVVGVWTASLVLAAPWIAVYTVREYELPGISPFSVCADDWAAFGWHRPAGFLVLFIVDYVVPVAAIGALSALTVVQLWATETTGDGGPAQRQSVVAKQRVTRLIVVVVVVFAVCWLPSHVVWLWTNFFRSSWRHTYGFYYGRIGAHVLSYANSCMNPFIYAFVSSRFRREFRRALYCRDPGLAAWSAGGAVAGSSAVDQRQNVRRDAGAPQPTSLQMRSVVVATMSRHADRRPTSMTLLSRNIPRPE